MWIFTTSGFISAVSNPDGTIKVRSRDKASLGPLSKRYELEIAHTPIADYPYRYLHQQDSILEQYWDRKEGSWNHTIRLSKMISGGESSLERITEKKARQLLPEAFKNRLESK